MNVEDQSRKLNYQIYKRPPIKEVDKIKLWVRSGGRCAICNKYLLDIEYDVSKGEMAHIVGWSKASKSPRGNSELLLEERNTADNLILLCPDHHKIIDTPNLLDEFTVERLINCKINHEARINHLTSLGSDSETLIIRVLGGIRGAEVEVSKEHIREVVYRNSNKFPVYLNNYDNNGIEVNLNFLPDPEDTWSSYWIAGTLIIDKALGEIKKGIQAGAIRHISLFALARIPLLLYLGYKLDDKIPTSIYQKHRDELETWVWDINAPIESFEINQLIFGKPEKIALILSISGSISSNSLPSSITSDFNLFEIRPVNSTPHRNVLRHRQSLINFTNTYHKFLSQLEVTNKDCRQIHLFLATPLSAAIVCGRGLMKNVHPELIIYDFTNQSYKRALTINCNESN